MAPPSATQNGGRGGGGDAEKYKNAPDAKHLLDMIGENVHKKVHNAALTRSGNKLKGHLSQATFTTRQGVEASHVSDPCELEYQWHTNVTGGFDTNNPCANRLDVRFSDKYGGQCTDTKIKGNVGNNGGACAPFRRLFLCDHHLSHMKVEKINTKDNLLLEVLLAAKYEGQSLVKKYNEYKERHNVIPSDICTVLARSFADIGDIVRGKDLFIGYDERDRNEKAKLQENLTKIFNEIYNKLGDTEAQERYKGDADNNYFQLREDWWYANRAKVWYAITCGAGESDKYFRRTCGDGKGPSQAKNKCRCSDKPNTDQVPTYFDYVPQYLRWFEEWAEDFCRLRKHKLKDAKEQCRGRNNDKYCSRNGYDCKKTVRAKRELVKSEDCKKCTVPCDNFVHWIDNQKQEFEKQKKKYGNEIKKAEKKKETSNGPINNLYVSDFYKELETNYKDVEHFLEKLSKEQICEGHPDVKGKTSIDFKNHEKDDIFSHTEYCKTCAWCGVKEQKGEGKWEDRQDTECRPENNDEFNKDNTTDIQLLSTDKAQHDILEKYKNFCKNGNNEIKKWQCHYERTGNDNCIEGEWNNFRKDQTIKPYELFFSHWIKRMLEDSIKWREQFNNCINNENATKCIKGCKTPCECYKKWVERMKEEWGDIKKHFHKEKNHIDNHHFTTLEMYLELEFLPSIEDAYGNDEAIDKIEELLEERRTHKDSELMGDKKDIIDYLLKHEEDDAKECTTTHNNNECPEEVNLHNNPCSEHVNKPTASVKDIARKMKSNARRQLGISGRKALKANASLGTYKRSGDTQDFKKNLCNINQSHSNANDQSNDPCNGKGDRFKIGKTWEQKHSRDTTNGEFYLPPRRQHMCTSNLEHIDINKITRISNVNDTFLGDVLLAAKKEGDFIVEKLKSNGNQPGICRAIKYSFADIGDIIRGKDLWDEDKGAQDMEKNLVTIFGKIKENIDDDDIKDKYKESEPYKQLRSDWWEANRYQVWNAMKCATRKEKIPCHGMPVDDYIPQRLRWMTEWAEWYCKEQSQAYEELEEKCRECRSGICNKVKDDCAKCTQACKEYKTKIDTWKQQWQEMEIKYTPLYHQAKTTSTNARRTVFLDAGPDYQQVVEFFKELQKANGDTKFGDITSPYFTAAGYIHQELQQVGCNTQKEFCDNNKGKYTFEKPPTEYKDACECNSRQPQAPKKEEEKKDACDIVDGILAEKKGNEQIGECNPKIKDKNDKYPDWQCGDANLVEDLRVCMPPRRQKLCVHFLADKNEIQHIDNQDKLREAFIKCAAAETFFSWYYYKSKDGNDANELIQNLKKGEIPAEFLRSMFYTYGDYRDFLFGTDISKGHGKGSNLENKINSLFPENSDGKSPGNLSRENWWKTNGSEIWKGMLCALEKAGAKKSLLTEKYNYSNVTFTDDHRGSKLIEFAKRPQFLRWMTEWAEWFCKMQKKAYEELEGKCKKCKTKGDSCTKGTPHCTSCDNQCKEYGEKIKTWQKQWETMSFKYQFLYWQAKNAVDNNKGLIGFYADDKDKHVFEFLKQLYIANSGTTTLKTPYSTAEGYIHQELQQVGCNTQTRFCEETHPEYAFKHPPNGYDVACKCMENEEKTKKEETQPTVVDACGIVGTLFSNTTALKEACALKYGKNAPTSWKCIPTKPNGDSTRQEGEASNRRVARHTTDASGGESGSSDSNQGAICVPPRRRKLYLGGFDKFISGHATQARDQATEALRDAFIESAAVETFFLWDRYKKIKLKEKLEEQARQNGELPSLNGDSVDGGDQTPQNKLQTGKIPPDFLRQMFYTLGDYRDIVVHGGSNTNGDTKDGGDSSNNNNIVFLASGKENKEAMKKIQEQLKAFFKNGANPENSGSHPSKQSNSVNDPKDWWNKHAESIWNGMICALSYDTNERNFKEEVHNILIKPDNNNIYNTVTISSGVPSTDSTPLSDFASRPTFYRWLQEWGEEFCRTQTRMLGQIKMDCMDVNKQKYSGDGEACDEIVPDKGGTIKNLESPSCANSCRFYKKWISRKKDEFIKQQKIYNGELDSAKSNSHDNGFSTRLKTTCPEVKDFLQKLGPCSKTDNGNESVEGKTIFENTEETFKPATNCKPCPVIGAKCKNGVCNGGGTENKCNVGRVITKDDINKSTEQVSMRVSDESGNGFDGGLETCKDAHIFKGFRKEEWKCANVCGYDVCGLKNKNNGIDEKEIILIRALFKRWLEYFLEDYNKINAKISHCMKRGDGSKCIKECKKKCDCVEKWIENKKKEWEEIKKRYLEHYNANDSDNSYSVKSFLQQGMFNYDVDNAIKPCGSLDDFQDSKECAVAANSENGHTNKKDIVECLLDKLETKAKNCPGKPSGENPENQCEQPPPLPDDEEQSLEEDEQNTVGNQKVGNKAPAICGDIEEQKEEEEGDCKAAETPIVPENGGPKEDEEGKGENGGIPPTGPQEPSPKADSDGEANPETPKPTTPKDLADHPAVIPALMSSTIMWSIGIGFATFTYFYLKKKTKASVGNLFQILQIPKSDYDIPTKLSPNRYIPYTSGKYRGKRYIYLEGDSGTDSGYTDHYSDITSSSESEYEELDINDIYVPGSPKYKTLIEVVLEPSGNNTTASGKNTPSDTQNDIPNNDTPSSKITDNEWNTLKHDFISNMLQSEQNTEPNMLGYNVDNNTNPKTLHVGMEEKPFIMSIHDRNLYSGEEYSYNVNMVNSMDDPKYVSNNVYSGIDLINDSLNSGNQHIDIYDELLKRKENELFGTNHVKHTTINRFAKPARDDPIHNQLELFHKWLDRHRNMCEKWENHHERLAKLKEEWENETHSGNTHPSDSNKTLNTDVSIQIHMDNPKPINEFTNMDTILEDLEKYNEPYYYDMYDDDIYYDVNDHDASTVDSNNMDVPSKVQIEMDVNTKLVKEKYPIADVWDI